MNRFVLFLIVTAIALSVPMSIEDCRQAASTHIILRSNISHSLKSEVLRDEHFILYDYSPRGFVAVSRDSDIRPIIAWSFESELSGSELGIIDILRKDLQNRHLVLHRTLASTIATNNDLWHQYLSTFTFQFLDFTECGPWTTTTWNQGAPYNALCPVDPVTGEICPTGCVITCVAQILNYWEYPYSLPLTEADSYTSESTDPPIEIDATTANMDTIRWNSDTLAEPGDIELARIMWAIGVKLQAGYQDGGTMAHMDADILREGFLFPCAEDYSISRPGYRALARSNMQEGKIAYVSMSGVEAGHAMVLDGWEESGSYHINMGWGGSEDAWYYLFDEIPLDFIGITGMILNIVANYHWDYANSCSDAEVIIPGTIEKKKINTILPTDDVDWFTFHAVEDSSYLFWSTGPNNMYMTIYDACDGEEVFNLTTGETENNFLGIFAVELGGEGDYYIKVGATEAIMDVNYQFWYKRILGPDRPSINIMSPAAGATVIGGETQSIFFSKTGTPPISRVKIEFSVSGNDGPWELIVDSLVSSFYTWNVPDFDEELYDYRHSYLKISDIASPVFQISESAFRIRDPEKVLENQPSSFSLNAYPNPFNSAINIDYTSAENASITIVDTKGQTLMSNAKLNGNGTFTFSPDESIPSGILLINFTSGNTIESRKVSYIK